ncbi:MAG TPA: YHS domain-containing protein, partial [Dehalococcoidia bacterium]|nr:YHS domain-containing protein [Dehalococcoidia bacterium]
LSSLSVVTNANRLRTYKPPALAATGLGHAAGVPRIEVTESQQGGALMPTVKDPVCGMNIDPDTAHASAEYEGKKYFFCSASCHESFEADPEPYVSPTG